MRTRLGTPLAAAVVALLGASPSAFAGYFGTTKYAGPTYSDAQTGFGAAAGSAAPGYQPVYDAGCGQRFQTVYQTVNDGPYRVAGAATQADYERLRQAMIATLEELDRRLAGRRLLMGGQLTEADVRLWPTLARFDTGYNPMAGVSERRLTDFPNLWAYARDLYQRPAFRDTTDFTSPPLAAVVMTLDESASPNVSEPAATTCTVFADPRPSLIVRSMPSAA